MEAADLEISIRRVGVEDHINIVKLFQVFDKEKYKFLREAEVLPDSGQNNNSINNATSASRTSVQNKNSLSLAGLRIDERGGIYLNPLLDSNSAYFKCYVAEEVDGGQLLGYILFFNTLEERAGNLGAGMEDPVAVVEDFFVKPAFRRRGIGTQLWRKVLKSSLDRGCSSCECLLLPKSTEGLRFWERRIGPEKIQQLLRQPRRKESQQELVLEISRQEMRQLYEQITRPDNTR